MHNRRCHLQDAINDLSSDFDKRRIRRLASAHRDVINVVGDYLEESLMAATYRQLRTARDELIPALPQEQPEEEVRKDDLDEDETDDDEESDQLCDEEQVTDSSLPFELFDLSDVALDDERILSNENCGYWLEALAKPSSRNKCLPECSDEQVDALHRLALSFPNFADTFKVIFGAARLSARSGISFQMPPLLLDGPPGIGKTELVKRLATILELPLIDINMAHLHGRFELFGAHKTWKQAEPGMVFQKLLECHVGNPIVLFDEAELGASELYQPLYHLVEDDKVRDHFLELPFDVSKLNLVFITNDKRLLPEALRSRLFEFDVKQPSREEMKNIIRRIYKDVVLKHDLFIDFDLEIPEDCVDRLLLEPVRVAKKRIFAALCHAACQGDRTELCVSDFHIKQKHGASMGFTAEVSA